MNKDTLLEIIRWLGILPAAIIAPIITCIIFISMFLIGDLLSGELWMYFTHPEIFFLNHFFTSFAVFAIFGYTAVYAGTAMAPRYKRVVAFSLFGILAIIFGFISIISLLLTNIGDSWRIVANSIICIITAGIVAFNTENMDDSRFQECNKTDKFINPTT